jgi:predicted permease
MLRRLLNLFRPNRLEAEICEELAYHRDRSRGRFGNFTAIQVQTREASTIVWLETLVQDVRYGCRQLGRTPLVTLVAVLSLALGIGANTAIFSLINAVMLQSLPVRDPGRLVLFYDGVATGVYSGVAFPGDMFSYRCWEYFRDHNEAFEDLSAFSQGSEDVMMRLSSGAGRREPARGHLVSGSYFSVLGVQAAVGRVLTPADDALAAPPVAVISDTFWRRRFHADSSAIGMAVDLNGTVLTIVGVAPREFFGERVEQPPDFWLPLSFQPQIMQRDSLAARTDVYWLNLIGRLKPGMTLARAQAGLNTQLHQFYTAQAGAHQTTEQQRKIQAAHIELKPGGRGISWARFNYSEPLHLLMAIVALVLLIACANIASLLLARASARRRELFVRLALGSSRPRLIRQLLTESVLLALLGGAAGVALAWWTVKALGAAFGISPVIPLRPDLVVLGFTLGISVLAGIGFGLVPALRAGRIELRSSPEVRTQAMALSRFKPARALVILQVTLSFLLLTGAALLTHSLLMLESQDLGFQRENMLLVRTDPRAAGYQPAQLNALYRQIYDRLSALPGVVSATMMSYSPLSGRSSSGNFSLQGYTPEAGREMDMYIVNAGPGFFKTMGMPLLLGRSFGPRDTPASPLVAVVSQDFVREYLPGQNPIGRRFCKGAPFRDPGVEIVGVVADSKYYDPRANAKPMAYFAGVAGRRPCRLYRRASPSAPRTTLQARPRRYGGRSRRSMTSYQSRTSPRCTSGWRNQYARNV